MKETCTLGVDELHYEQIAKWHNAADPSIFIHEHLATLYFITDAFKCGDVLEIGTGEGASATAFVEAGAYVYTLDIEKKEGVKKMLDDVAPNRFEMIMCDSAKFTPTQSYDIVFIDGDHDYASVKRDIDHFSPHALKFLILHDITNPAHTGVGRAVKEFLRNNKDWDYYQWFNCNGLAVLKRRN